MMKDPSKIKEIAEQNDKVFIMCRRGNASKEATEFLLQNFDMKNAINVQGGITEYIKKVDGTLPLY